MIITEDLTFAILDMVCCMGWSVLAGIKIPGLIDGRTDKHIHEDQESLTMQKGRVKYD